MVHRDEEAARRSRDFFRTELMALAERVLTVEEKLAEVSRDLDRVERAMASGQSSLSVMW